MQTIDIHINDFNVLCERRGHNLELARGCVVNTNNDILTVDVSHPSYPNPTSAIKVTIERSRMSDRAKEANSSIGDGPGTELKNMLSYIGIKSTENCSCNKRARYMNNMGINWCKNNLDLVCDWLKEESEKRNIPYFKYAAKKIVELAISRAERKQNV
jgi:hypothetical protein